MTDRDDTVSAVEAAARLARFVRAIEIGAAPDPADAVWVAHGFRRFLSAAPEGISLEAAFALATAPGRTPWWAELRRQRRDHLIRQLARFHEGPTRYATAHRLAGRIRRYQADIWPRDRRTPGPPTDAASTDRPLLFELFRLGDRVPTGVRALADILDADEERSDLDVFAAFSFEDADHANEREDAA